MITLKVTDTQAAVLLRCLTHGENAVSSNETKNGVAHILECEIGRMRKQITNQLSETLIKCAADEYVDSN
jgi:hypothetical protein